MFNLYARGPTRWRHPTRACLNPPSTLAATPWGTEPALVGANCASPTIPCAAGGCQGTWIPSKLRRGGLVAHDPNRGRGWHGRTAAATLLFPSDAA
jgi:hypothetical protein